MGQRDGEWPDDLCMMGLLCSIAIDGDINTGI